jgi:AAA family ATP:ADP antiporter
VNSWSFLPGHSWLSVALPQLFSMLFFVMAELWKIALLTVLFWGLINQYIPLADAKKFYAPLMLGGSIGTMLAGPLIKVCTSTAISQGSWSKSLTAMMLALSFLSLIVAWSYTKLWNQFAGPKQEKAEQPPVSMWESIQLCAKSKYLLLLAWLTVADYIAYTLGEVIFLDILKQKFPNPTDYCNYNGKLSFYSGLLTALCALIISPLIMRKSKWVVATLITPFCLLVTEGAFFLTLWTGSPTGDINLIILLGTVFFCVVRAAKYTLFDTSKEISFLLLPPLEKMQGKLVIDGICSRLGRGGASLLSLFLIHVCGGVVASSLAAGSIALVIGVSCVSSTLRLGTLVEKLSKPKSAPEL